MASKQSGPGCLILFGLVFIVAGCIPGCIAMHDLASAQASGGWTETTATLLRVELRHGEDTASVEARYRYRAPDPDATEAGSLREYESEQVGINDGSDNIGDWQLETYARLDAALREGRTVPCWYDPQDPAQAVLDREERWELVGFMMIFPLVFGLVGGGIVLAGLGQWRRQRRPPADPAAAARTDRIPADGGGTGGLWIATIVWNAISWTAVVGIAMKAGAPTFVMLMVALFPLIGLILLWAAVQGTVRTLRHGRPELRLVDGSWTCGTRVRARVAGRTAPQPGDRIAARLRVLRRETTGSGKNRSTREVPLWNLDLEIDPQAAVRAEGLWMHDLDLPLPGDLPAAGEDLLWHLEWHLIRPGPDLAATFSLPVAAGDGDGGLIAAQLAAEADRAAPLAVLLRAGVRIDDDGNRVVVSLPPFRNPSLYLTGAICCALLSLGAWALWSEVGWWTAFASVPLLALCWRGALRSALWRARIELTRERITVRHGWWRMHEADAPLREVLEVERKSSMSSGETSWFNMWLATGDGARIPIARGLPGAAAGRLADLIDRARR